MLKKISQAKWLRYVIETLTLTLLLGIFGGVIVGLVRGWKYYAKEFYLVLLHTINLSVDDTLFVAFIFLFIFMLVFFALRYVIKSDKWSCFIASAIACSPFFLIWGLEINNMYGIRRNFRSSNYFDPEAIILDLKLGTGFILLWFLISIGLFLWAKLRVLKESPVNVRLLSSLIAIILIFNVSTYFFYNFHTVQKDSPNVIILLIDCLRADHLSLYGYDRETTQNIDKFAKDSVVFTQAISQGTFTKTSIASLFTSLYTYQHGVYRGAGDGKDIRGNVTTDVLSQEETTLAEVLLKSEFLTTAWIQQEQLSSYLGFAQGFIDYNERLGKIDVINKKFLRWEQEIGKTRKFFAYIHYLDLHGPYRPKPPYDTLYLDEVSKDGEKPKWLDVVESLYDGLITHIDTEIGILLDNLKKDGLYDNTLIILTADHGDAFREHGFIGHSKAPYEELIRVPLIIKFPKSLHAGKVIKNQVRLIDIMPTILDFLKIKTDGQLAGFSLMNYLDSRKKDEDHKVDYPKYAITEIFNKRHHIDALSIRTEEFKYIHFRNSQDELYNLKMDPGENNNVIKLMPEVAEVFNEMLPTILSKRNQKRVDTVKLDEKTIKELETLGYIQ